MFIRDCSLVKPYPVLLFGGDIVVKHTEQALIVDDWISFQVVNDGSMMCVHNFLDWQACHIGCMLYVCYL